MGANPKLPKFTNGIMLAIFAHSTLTRSCAKQSTNMHTVPLIILFDIRISPIKQQLVLMQLVLQQRLT